jgi:hypothetical protein
LRLTGTWLVSNVIMKIFLNVKSTAASLPNMAHFLFPVHIEVNTYRPEENGPCMIFAFQNKKQNRFVYDGFNITIECDLRDLLHDRYDAQLLSDHEVLVQIPAYSYSYLHDIAAYNEEQKCAAVKQSHIVNRNAVVKDPKRFNKLFLYIFKKPLINVFSVANEEEDYTSGRIASKLQWWPLKYTVLGQTINQTVARISWILAVKESNVREIEVGKKKKTNGLAQLEKSLAGMKFCD